ncbi:MAG: hypothetical protein MUC88_20825 [Planctomycetes bacterium]|nr:hypothetical protein [Planctomycetota bacterium]
MVALSPAGWSPSSLEDAMIQARMFVAESGPFVGLMLFEDDKTIQERGDALLKNWKDAYPNVNVEAEIRKAHSWLISNPRRRKKNLSRFLNNWIKSASRQPENTWSASARVMADAMRQAMG